MRTAIMLVICLATSAAGAQTVERGTKMEKNSRYGGFGFFVLSYQAQDQTKINGALSTAGFPNAPATSFDLGGGGYFRLNRVIVGGTGQWMLGGTTKQGDKRVDARGGYGLLELGFVAVDGDSYWLYPIVGVGGGGLSYRVGDGNSATFAGALTSPLHESTVDTGGLLLEVGIGADVFHFHDQADGRAGAMIGLRVGWLFQPTGAGWSNHDNDVSGGPDQRMGGPLVRLILGGGGFSWK